MAVRIKPRSCSFWTLSVVYKIPSPNGRVICGFRIKGGGQFNLFSWYTAHHGCSAVRTTHKGWEGRGHSGCGTRKEILNCNVNVCPFIGECSTEFFVTQRTYPQGSEGSTLVCSREVPGSNYGPEFSFAD
jgi:hypothetical protein